jgi:hypothetical protein
MFNVQIDEVCMDLETNVLLGISVVMIGGVIFLGGTLAVGIVTGAISAVSLGILLLKVRTYYPGIWQMICDHPFASDLLISCCLFLLVSSNTATGVIAGAAAGLFSSIGINLMVKFDSALFSSSKK